MKIEIKAEVLASEVINDFILPKIKENGIVVNTGDFKVFVHSEKQDKEVEVKPENVRFVFSR